MNASDEQRLLAFAEALEKYGIYRTALKVLALSPHLYGQRANSLRRRLSRNASAGRLPPGIYLLAVSQSLSSGCVVPLRAERGDCKASAESCGGPGSRTAQAFHLASELARRAVCSAVGLPGLYIVVPESLPFAGESVGLAATLAFVEKWSGTRAPIPVLATGALDAAGNILAVEGLSDKIDAALTELADSPGLVLIPGAQASEAANANRLSDRLRPVRTLEEAVRAVWSEYPLAVDRSLISLEATLQEAQTLQDPARALHLLLTHPQEDLAPADLARLLFAIGTQYRHLGQSHKAAELRDKARKLLVGSEGAVGRQAVETLEMEAFATEMDLFALEGLETELRARLRQPFLSDHNKVRCQGMLAQLLSTVGLHDEAVRLRQSNLAIQTANEAMKHEIPRTLACLAYESARGGMADLFEKTVSDLFDKTDPGDALQSRYNLCAVARGLVLLGRHMDLLDWARGRVRLWEQQPNPNLVRLVSGETSKIEATHPEVSLVRALVRALRRSGDLDRALALASSLQIGIPAKDDLVYWLAALIQVEGALALNDSGQKREAQAVLASAVDKLKISHALATQFYSLLLAEVENATLGDESVKKIEIGLDRVYY